MNIRINTISEFIDQHQKTCFSYKRVVRFEFCKWGADFRPDEAFFMGDDITKVHGDLAISRRKEAYKDGDLIYK